MNMKLAIVILAASVGIALSASVMSLSERFLSAGSNASATEGLENIASLCSELALKVDALEAKVKVLEAK